MKTTGNSADDLMEFLQDKKQQSDTNSSSFSEEEEDHDNSSSSSGYDSVESDDSSKTTTSNSISSSIHRKKHRKRRNNKVIRSNSSVQDSSNSIISISSSSSSITTTTPRNKVSNEPEPINSNEPSSSKPSDKDIDAPVITVNAKLARLYPSPASVGPGYVPLALSHSSESSVMSGSKGKRRTRQHYNNNLPPDDNDINEEFDYDDVETTTSSLSSYAGSALSQDDEQFIPSQYITDRITNAMDPALLDRVIVVQAQTSGSINAKSLEIAELRKKATERLAELKAIFADGSKIAKQVARDLEWSQKKTKYVYFNY